MGFCCFSITRISVSGSGSLTGSSGARTKSPSRQTLARTCTTSSSTPTLVSGTQAMTSFTLSGRSRSNDLSHYLISETPVCRLGGDAIVRGVMGYTYISCMCMISVTTLYVGHDDSQPYTVLFYNCCHYTEAVLGTKAILLKA